METLYDVPPNHLLQMVQINHTKSLYLGNNKAGNQIENWANNVIIELLQKYYHQMLKENTFKG